MSTGKTTALTIRTFVVRVTSLLFGTLSRFVVAFLPRSNCLLISWLQSPSAVILEPKKRKSVTTCTFSPSICHEVMGLVANSVKNLPANLETRIRSLVWEYPLEKEMVTYFSMLASRVLWTEEPGRPQSMGSQESDMT